MIKEIRKISIPEYARITDATVSLSDMGERTITATVKIDGGITPDFSHDWIVEYRGERYIMPLRQPQASKENTSLDSTIELTFYHKAIYELKRYYFIELTSEESGTAIADKYIASVSLNLGHFCDLLKRIFKYWYGDNIAVDLNKDWVFKTEPEVVEISYSYIWDVLLKLYELYGVRWTIDGGESAGTYIVRIGYPSQEVSHIFEYGFDGGLLKVERQVQDNNIRNIILGRGGEKNLPYRYFKQTDENNISFYPDPDWCPELSNIYFANLHGKTFRDYIRGWNEAHHSGTKYPAKDRTWAYLKGLTDSKFNPVEFVKDDESIAKYGELWGGLDNNDEIYPTIQGVSIDPMGRVDETVCIEQVKTDGKDDTQEDSEYSKSEFSVTPQTWTLAKDQRKEISLQLSQDIVIPDGKRGNLIISITPTEGLGEVENITVVLKNKLTGNECSASGIGVGTYTALISATLHNVSGETKTIQVNYSVAIETAIPHEWNNNVFCIWIKNLWKTSKQPSETNTQYAERVWLPILGDRTGEEAKVIFASGFLSTSEDYEFTIVKTPEYDTSKTLNGVNSHWKLTLAKSDVDYESLVVMVPNTKRQGKDGDFFFFVGIDMPHNYVLWAEERLDAYKLDQLNKVKEIKPTWVVTPDNVKWANEGKVDSLLNNVSVGNVVTIRDKRFINGSQIEELYVQSANYKYSCGSLIPDIEIVLSDDYATTGNVVAQIQSDISALQKQLGSISNIEDIISRIGNKKYLRKDTSDNTPYKLGVDSLTVGHFKQSLSGASVDKLGNAEFESIVSRSFLKVFELIYNRINALEGDYSFADSGTIENVEYNPDSTITLAIRKRWDGDFTAFQKGDILYGYVNDLDNPFAKTWGKAWVRIISVNRIDNTIDVLPYADIDVPGNGNLPVSNGMILVRWGNAIIPCEEVAYDSECASFIQQLPNGQWINNRQKSFMLSSDGGNIIELMGVDAPIVKPESYTAVLGQLPTGLVDEDTAKLLNPGQPYLYARGIVVQDLIRIGYKGVNVRTPNFRGEWDAKVAEDENQFYRISNDLADVVTYNGVLWQYVSNEKDVNPPSDDNAHWLRLTGGDLSIWNLAPSANVIYIRGDKYSEHTLECIVNRTSSMGVEYISTPEVLDSYNMRLMFSLDDVHYGEYWIRSGDTVGDLEIGENGGMLDLGGNNIPWMEVQDNIFLALKDAEGRDVCRFVIPVVKDGIDGDSIIGADGRDGEDGTSVINMWKTTKWDEPDPDFAKNERFPYGWLSEMPKVEQGYHLWQITARIGSDNKLAYGCIWEGPVRLTAEQALPGERGASGKIAYPAGNYDVLVEYRSDNRTIPVVMDGTQNGLAQYYILKEDVVYCGLSAPEGRKTPHEDAALGGDDAKWERMDRFDSIYTDIIMADFGKIGDAVFFGPYMMSMQGISHLGDFSDNYKEFKNGTFFPNFAVDFKTGKVTARDIEFYGFSRQIWATIKSTDFDRVIHPEGRVVKLKDIGTSVKITGSWNPKNWPCRIELPQFDDAMTFEELERMRSYVGTVAFVYNYLPGETATIIGNYLTETKSLTVNNDGHRVYTTRKESLPGEVEISPKKARTFRCILAANADTGIETLAWEVGDEVIIRE